MCASRWYVGGRRTKLTVGHFVIANCDTLDMHMRCDWSDMRLLTQQTQDEKAFISKNSKTNEQIKPNAIS